jgi:hypothetical protein
LLEARFIAGSALPCQSVLEINAKPLQFEGEELADFMLDYLLELERQKVKLEQCEQLMVIRLGQIDRS